MPGPTSMQRRTSVSSMGGASGAGSGQGNSGSTSGNGADSRQALAHKRAAHGGSGSNTEMRAILRRERELERQRETEALRKGLNSRNSESRLSASGYDEDSARSRTLSRSTGPGAQQGNLAGRTSKDSQIGKEPQQQHAKLSPPDSFDHSFGLDALQAAFSAKYYELANKCKNWERYAAKLRAQAEALEAENRLLQEINVRQEAQISALELENVELKDESRHHERERRIVVSRLSSLEDRLSSRSHSGGDLSGQYQSAEAMGLGLDISTAPSAPTSVSKSAMGSMPGSMSMPFCSSNLYLDQRSDMRPPTPMSAISLPGPLRGPEDLEIQPALASIHAASSSADHRPGSGRTAHRQGSSGDGSSDEWHGAPRRDSLSLAEILAQDAANRETAALFGEGRSSRLGNRTLERSADTTNDSDRSGKVSNNQTVIRHGNARGLNENRDIPSPVLTGMQDMGVSGPASLTSQALAAINNSHATSGLRAPGYQAAQRLTVSPRTSAAHKRQPSMDGQAANAPKRRSMNGAEAETNLTSASVPNLPMGLWPPSRSEATRCRNGSAHSDAATVTGDYLHEYMQERRSIRRASLTQQQQMHAVQGQQRSSSRLSNLSAGERNRSKARSRSNSVHDAIPIAKDDIFSDVSPNAPSSDSYSSTSAQGRAQPKQRGPSPLMQNDAALNALHAAPSSLSLNLAPTPAPSAIDGRSSVDPDAIEEIENIPPGAHAYDPSESPSPDSKKQRGIASSGSGSVAGFEDDSEGQAYDQRVAHRRLYGRLRAELDAADLVKFEKYVHRYDALEIPLDGPRGLINRVKKLLLLTDPDLRNKPEQLRMRKELAREFERIVKVDLE